jgi:YD repeat-containing protein
MQHPGGRTSREKYDQQEHKITIHNHNISITLSNTMPVLPACLLNMVRIFIFS